MDIKTFIFDFDGTIIDTEFADFEAWRQVFSEYGAPLTLPEWISGFGTLDTSFHPVINLSQKIGKSIPEDILHSQFTTLYNQLLEQLPVLPGLENYIQFAQEHHIILAIASGGRKEFILKQLRRLNLIDYFSSICTFTDVGRSKPDPAIYNCILRKLNTSPNHAIAFEDSPFGVRAAQSANIFCIGVKNRINIHIREFTADLMLESLLDYSPLDLMSKISSVQKYQNRGEHLLKNPPYPQYDYTK